MTRPLDSVEEPEISLAVIAGTPTVRPMRLTRSIMGEQLVILVDLGSSHNFIDSTLIPKWKLRVDSSITLRVKVANGQCLKGGGLYKIVKLKVQATLFQPSLHLLDLVGCDIVLGI